MRTENNLPWIGTELVALFTLAEVTEVTDVPFRVVLDTETVVSTLADPVFIWTDDIWDCVIGFLEIDSLV